MSPIYNMQSPDGVCVCVLYPGSQEAAAAGDRCAKQHDLNGQSAHQGNSVLQDIGLLCREGYSVTFEAPYVEVM